MMKKALALVLALTMVLAMAACGAPAPVAPAPDASGSAAPAPEAAPPAAPAAGGMYPGTPGTDSIVVNLGSEPPEMNTIQTTDTTSGNVMRHTVVALTMLDENDNAIPGMAKDWKVSEDGLTYTFNLRKDMKWTNGDPVTAKDFIFAWTQVLTPATAAQYNYMGFAFKNGKAFYEGKAKIEDVGFKAIDDYTLEIVLENPQAYFLSQLSFYTFAPVNEKFYNEVGADNYAKEVEYLCTNGPYKVTEWVHEEKIVLTKNDAHPDAAKYTIKTIDMRMIKDTNTAMNAFKAGEIDMIGLLNDQPAMIAAEGYPILHFSDGGSWYFEYNTKATKNDGSKNPLSNKKIRQALTLSIDADSFIKNILKNDSVAGSVLTSPAIMGYDGKVFNETVGQTFTRDAAKAKTLMEEGMKELGITIDDMNKIGYVTDDTDNSAIYAAFFQEQWKTNLGFTMQVQAMPFKSRLERMTNKDFDIVMAGWGPDYNDPMTFIDLWVTGGGNNHTSWSNAAYDKLVADATVEADAAKRQQMFIDAEKILADEMPIGMIYYRYRDYVCSEKLTGVVRTAFQDIDLTSASIVTK